MDKEIPPNEREIQKEANREALFGGEVRGQARGAELPLRTHTPKVYYPPIIGRLQQHTHKLITIIARLFRKKYDAYPQRYHLLYSSFVDQLGEAQEKINAHYQQGTITEQAIEQLIHNINIKLKDIQKKILAGTLSQIETLLTQDVFQLFKEVLEEAQPASQQEFDKQRVNMIETISEMSVEDGRAPEPTTQTTAIGVDIKVPTGTLSAEQLWHTIDETLKQEEEQNIYLLGNNPKLRERRQKALQTFLTENASFAKIGEVTGLKKGGAYTTVQRSLELVFPHLPENVQQEYESAENIYKQIIASQPHGQRIKKGLDLSKQSGHERKPRKPETQPRKPRKPETRSRKPRKPETQPRKKSETRSQRVSEANTKRWKHYHDVDEPQGKPAFSEQGLANIRAGRRKQKEVQQTTLLQAEQTVVDFTKSPNEQSPPRQQK